MDQFKISSTDATKAGFGDFPVLIIEHTLIPLSDGVKLAAKVWFPQFRATSFEAQPSHSWLYYLSRTEQAEEQVFRFPAVLEYLPYRKDDVTASRDHLRHPWMCSHGYVVMRVDCRGSGDSEGLCYGEYLQQEQTDCIDILNWIGTQAWSTGKVGMYGKSWGGFNGLQVAYEQPPQLKAVISLYSTDDRYKLDVNHDGGCVIDELLSWASIMFLKNAMAPDPRYVRNYQDVWEERLDKASAPWAVDWLKHQARDEFWKHGSICEDFDRVQCPVLAIGGMKDPYKDAILRMVQNMKTVFGVIGPWPHEWPDKCTPGPNIEFMQLCLQWWDYHLKGKQNGALDCPRLRVYLQDCYEPNPELFHVNGTWVGFSQWPPAELHTRECTFHGKTLFVEPADSSQGDLDAAPARQWELLQFNPENGMMSQGRWLEFGGPHGPTDQAIDDGLSRTYTSVVQDRELCLFGLPYLEINFRLQQPSKCPILTTRLCSISPDGRSTRLTYGMINLLHRNGHAADQLARVDVGQEYSAKLEMHLVNYTLPKGHCLRLSVSPNLWPQAWPAHRPTHIEILTGAGGTSSECCKLHLPVVDRLNVPRYQNELFQPTKDPKIGFPLPKHVLEKPRFNLSVHRDLTRGITVRKEYTNAGRTILIPQDVIMSENQMEQWEIDHVMKDGLLHAKATSQNRCVMEYPNVGGEGHVTIEVEATSVLTADEDNFYLECELRTKRNGTENFSRIWREAICREWC